MSDSFVPSGTEPRLPSPIGGPHSLMDGSVIFEFLQPPEQLDASVLIKTTWVGSHASMKLGKNHPQAPPYHLHFLQSESFVILSGAVGTTTTYAPIDTVITPTGSHPQTTPPANLDPPVPARSGQGVVQIPPYTPHRFWPVSPEHSFWDTPEGQKHEAAAAQGRQTDTVMLLWAHPRNNTAATGKYARTFPPDMDAVFFVAFLALINALEAKRLTMSPSVMAILISLQYESESPSVVAPSWSILGPLRWWVPWTLFGTVSTLRTWFGGKPIGQVAEDLIDQHIVKQQ